MPCKVEASSAADTPLPLTSARTTARPSGVFTASKKSPPISLQERLRPVSRANGTSGMVTHVPLLNRSGDREFLLIAAGGVLSLYEACILDERGGFSRYRVQNVGTYAGDIVRGEARIDIERSHCLG